MEVAKGLTIFFFLFLVSMTHLPKATLYASRVQIVIISVPCLNKIHVEGQSFYLVQFLILKKLGPKGN